MISKEKYAMAVNKNENVNVFLLYLILGITYSKMKTIDDFWNQNANNTNKEYFISDLLTTYLYPSRINEVAIK
jgi:hypothetical protein